MKIKVIGAGWFGCHTALSLIEDGHEVELHEQKDTIFAGASGNIPARLHLGAPHYPRSALTQQACLQHQADFMAKYGHLTRPVPVNIYAVADTESIVDFGTYKMVLENQIEILTMYSPAEFGLQNVEGAVLTGERHVVTSWSKKFFEEKLADVLLLNSNDRSEDGFDYVVDCTFCANDEVLVDRFEPCLVLQLRGPSHMAITIMDGPFPSLYPWDEDENLLSLSSAKWSPFSKECKTWTAARELLDNLTEEEIDAQAEGMLESMAHFYPAVRTEYEVVEKMLSIRAMPLSKSDSRLIHVAKMSDKLIRIRSGKIDAVIEAGNKVKELMSA